MWPSVTHDQGPTVAGKTMQDHRKGCHSILASTGRPTYSAMLSQGFWCCREAEKEEEEEVEYYMQPRGAGLTVWGSLVSTRSEVLEDTGWEVNPADITICKDPTGNNWQLGTGGFGSVRLHHQFDYLFWQGSPGAELAMRKEMFSQENEIYSCFGFDAPMVERDY